MSRVSHRAGLPPLLACLGLLVLWEVAARAFDISGLPPAHEALRALPAILGDPEALLNIAHSMRRMAIGFALALAFAVPVGLMMGRSRLVAAFFNPLLMTIYPVPKAALMPIIMLWLGIGDASKTLVIFLGVSLPVIYHSYQGARAVEEKMLWSAAAMGMPAWRRLLHIVLPAALPEIFVGAAHRPGAGADHHGDERDDRAPGGRRQHPVQLARHGAIRCRLRHHRHHRRARLRARRGVRAAAVAG